MKPGEAQAPPQPQRPPQAPVAPTKGIPNAQWERLTILAGTRSQTVEETMADCLRWLEEGPTAKSQAMAVAAVVPEAAGVPLHPDGQPYCKCDGTFNYGPHHRCHRHRPTERGEGDFS